MYVYFNANKEPIEIISDNITTGSSSNEIYAFWDSSTFDSINTCSIKYKMIDGDEIETEYVGSLVEDVQIPENEDRDYKYFKEYTNYKMAKFTIPSAVLSKSAGWIGIIRFATASSKWYAMSDITFLTNGSYEYDTTLTVSQFEYLLSNVVTIDGDQKITGIKTFDGDRTFFNGKSYFNDDIEAVRTSLDIGSYSIAFRRLWVTLINSTSSADNDITIPQKGGTMALLGDLDGYIPKSGGTTTGPLVVESSDYPDGAITLKCNGEGGNIDVKSKSGTYGFQMDCFNDNIVRLYVYKVEPWTYYSSFAYNIYDGLWEFESGIELIKTENIEKSGNIYLYDYDNSVSYEITIPLKSGTMALTDDIPTKTSDIQNDSGFITSSKATKLYLHNMKISGTGGNAYIRFTSTYASAITSLTTFYDSVFGAGLMTSGIAFNTSSYSTSSSSMITTMTASYTFTTVDRITLIGVNVSSSFIFTAIASDYVTAL